MGVSRDEVGTQTKAVLNGELGTTLARTRDGSWNLCITEVRRSEEIC
jgi:hypothetical protein